MNAFWTWPNLFTDLQSTLAPAGPHAEAIAGISWAMFIGGGLILLLVVVMTALATLAPEGWRRGLGRRRTIVLGGIALPVVVLTALLYFGLVQNRVLSAPDAPRLRVAVSGEMWWWRVDYLDAQGESALTTANEIRIPVGVPVEFRLTSADVIHSFWIPALAGKLDMIPGRVNTTTFSADRPGVYRGQCAEYCGAQHANMAFYVVAMEEAEFAAWYASQAAPAPEPVTEAQAAGRALFADNGCGACHTVRGTEADGEIGPDLTHVGGRASLAAGILPNNIGTFGGWIASAQHIKPGNRMPSFDTLDGPELRALAAYMESLQ